MALTDRQWRTTIYGWVFMSSVMLAKAPKETHRCTASNGIGYPANQTTEVIVGSKL